MHSSKALAVAHALKDEIEGICIKPIRLQPENSMIVTTPIPEEDDHLGHMNLVSEETTFGFYFYFTGWPDAEREGGTVEYSSGCVTLNDPILSKVRNIPVPDVYTYGNIMRIVPKVISAVSREFLRQEFRVVVAQTCKQIAESLMDDVARLQDLPQWTLCADDPQLTIVAESELGQVELALPSRMCELLPHSTLTRIMDAPITR